MEPAKIDWKRLEWKFEEDQLYEHINAPKWFDFLAPDDEFVDDEAWFCKSDCKHPKRVEDFLKSTATKVFGSPDASKPDQNRRDVKLKRRMPVSSASSDGKLRFNQDSENQNPNLLTPSNNPLKPIKAAIKSSEEKKKPIDDAGLIKPPSVKSTLSAKNLFAGRPILNQITEFCSELKKLATRARERENAEILGEKKSEEVVERKQTAKALTVQALGESDGIEKERKPLFPLFEAGKAEKSEGSSTKVKQQRKKRPEDAENIPVPLDLEKVRNKREDSLMQIRTTPPSPQCFSATRGPNKTTPLKGPKSRLMERGILQEVAQKKEVVEDLSADNNRSTAIMDERETRALDVLWFLKPCTPSGA
ncbi:hypothetical protein L6164_023008 [Bauhinia variegata]|uniref:Uncharacterized protein n=1 Tax=Bauhinia variegata TaxID=167791 RepID=A0ACB9MI88_BAUVA|nr:hypothetical protein L6164_023008 [Bauhinia variegata]